MLKGELCATPEGARKWAEEGMILEASECICKAMKRAKVSRVEMAARLGVTQGWVTQQLDGNMSMRTFARYLHALGMTAKFVLTVEK